MGRGKGGEIREGGGGGLIILPIYILRFPMIL